MIQFVLFFVYIGIGLLFLFQSLDNTDRLSKMYQILASTLSFVAAILMLYLSIHTLRK